MPGPKLPEYPKPMFRADVDPIYANDAKHEDKLASDGWSVAYIYREYPKALYSPTDITNVVVHSRDEEDLYLEKGYLTQPEARHYGERNPNAGPELPLAGPAPGSPAASASQFDILQKQIIEQQALINSLLLEREDKAEKKQKKGAA